MIYRDIKPDNFLIGHSDPHEIYLIDFGMAKLYRDPRNGQHIPYRERKSLSGTARYMSINTHLGREQSRRDDLESLGHVFLYFLRGSLPWQGLKAATNREKYERIGDKKQSVMINELWQGHCSEEWGQYLAYCRALKFEETPDYEYARGLIDRCLARQPRPHLVEYDWDGKAADPPVFGGIKAAAPQPPHSPIAFQPIIQHPEERKRSWFRRIFCL